MRVVFAGTPGNAAATLGRLVQLHEVVGVISRPDAPRGRSSRLVESEVSAAAESALGLELVKPKSLKEAGIVEWVRELQPDIGVVVAYGGLIPPELLEIPVFGWVNVHYSILPRWRGAAPVQRAILAGDEVTGVTVFGLVDELDAGPVYTVSELQITGQTAGELLDELTPLGAQALMRALYGIDNRALSPLPQADEGVTYAQKLTVAEGEIDWRAPAEVIERQVRAYNPAPLAWTTLYPGGDPAGERLQVLAAQPTDVELPPGEVRPQKRRTLVGTGTQALELARVRPAGRKEMAGADWGRGLRGDGWRVG
ncbi:MAG: methionyl-tRNA formyltransferase [Propionibacteriaceae bacterium]|jgi:methionyl-tRNA formyltransferase|nr:methionyl-tRNA formyltransferase [Propionibacteriaceae bacterium]